MKLILIIGTGGFIGSIARFYSSKFLQSILPSVFPLGTFCVNIVGCLLIGIFYGLAEKGNILDDNLRLFLTVGFCGGYTTFSTFANESMLLLKNGEYFYVALYTSLSVFLGLIAVYFGHTITKL